MALSCIVELCAEAPSFVTQVFCFVRVRIVLNTLHILVRSAVFLWIVINDKSVAINAFAIAQLMSTATIIIGNYGFFYFYIRRLNQNKKQNDMKDFPFTKLSEFFPGVMKNEVSMVKY